MKLPDKYELERFHSRWKSSSEQFGAAKARGEVRMIGPPAVGARFTMRGEIVSSSA
jgi:hypothetical protein